jgi:hypothetical protein
MAGVKVRRTKRTFLSTVPHPHFSSWSGSPQIPNCWNSATKAIAHGGLSDHTPLLTTVTVENYAYYPVPAPTLVTPEPRIVTPISAKRLAHFKKRMTETLSSQITEFYNITCNNGKELGIKWEELQDYELIKQQLGPNGLLAHLTASHKVASDLLLQISEGMAKVAAECLEYYTPGQHKKRYLSKKVQRQLRKQLDVCRYLNSLTTQTKEAMQQHRRDANPYAMCSRLLEAVNTISQKYDTTHQTMHTPLPSFPWTAATIETICGDDTASATLSTIHTWLAALKDIHTTTRQAMWKLRTEEKQEMGRKYRKHWQRVLAKTPKKAYKHIFRKAAAPLWRWGTPRH